MSLYDTQTLKYIQESTPQEKLNTLRPESAQRDTQSTCSGCFFEID